jgi:hypothetical protein
MGGRGVYSTVITSGIRQRVNEAEFSRKMGLMGWPRWSARIKICLAF